MKLKEVTSKKDWNHFLQFPRDLYRDDAEYISHLDKDIRAIFNPQLNSEFKNGEAKQWLVFDKAKVVGKIAAFYNTQSGQSGIGFFDCIDNQEVANLLFETAALWLKSKGQNGVEAPVNFGERDKYWGLLVEGFKSPSYQENYNFPYYQNLFENYGFEKILEQTTSEAKPENVDYNRYAKLSQQFTGLEVDHFKFNQINKYINAFVEIYNAAWQQHEHYVPLTFKRVEKLFKSMKPILREDIMLFMFDGDKPVAFYISVIDVNQIFKYLNGKMNFWAKLKFLYYKRKTKVNRIRGILFGVIPEYQNKGLYSAMLTKMHSVITNDPYITSTELAWIGDFNPKMHSLFENIKAVKTKLHYTYEKHL